ncbi:Aminotransferase class IV [Methylocella tundrae]|nr:Aminotransferase class IV [Methylocella tundrae]
MLWLDGAVFPDSRALFDLSDRGLLLGDGAFDTALVMNGRLFRGEAHIQRLLDALALLGIEADADTIRGAFAALLPRAERHALRVTVTRGPGLRGLAPAGMQKPTIMASLSPLPQSFFSPRLSMDVAAMRRNETSPASRIKALCYLDAILAMREATSKGYNETLFLNGAGRVACASVGNVFALFGDELATPPLADGVMPGIIRGFILAECGALKLQGRERSLDLDELYGADAVFMTNSLRLIAPAERIGAVAIGAKGATIVDALTQRLWQAITAECGSPPI